MKKNCRTRTRLKKAESPRFTLRISVDMNRELHALGRVEKRHMAKMVRTCLSQALDQWRKNHPAKISPPTSHEN